MWLQSANNAKWLILGDVLASAGFITIKDSKGWLFPSVYPYRCTITKVVNSVVTQREIVEVTNRVGDTFTITRGVEACPASDSATTQTTTAFAFSDNDSFQINRTNDKDVEVDANLDLKLDIQDYIEWKKVFNASAVWTDAYQITVTDLTSYVNGAIYRVQADVANAWPATLEINALGAKALKKTQGTEDLLDNDIKANGIFSVVYNSTLDVFQYSSQLANPVSADVDINGLVSKATPVDADELIIYDSVWADNKKLTWANLKTTLKTFFDTIYQAKSTFDVEYKMHFSYSNSWSDWQWFDFNWFAGAWSSWGPLGAFMDSSTSNQYIVQKVYNKNWTSNGHVTSLNWDQVEDLEFEFFSAWTWWVLLGFGDHTWNTYYNSTQATRKILLHFDSNTTCRLVTRDGSTQENSSAINLTLSFTTHKFKLIYSRTNWTCELYVDDVLQATNNTNMPDSWVVWFGIWQSSSSQDVSVSPIDIKINYT